MKKKRIIALINSPINSQKDLDKKDFDKILNKIVEKLLKGFRSNPALLHEKYDVKTAEGIESSTLIHFLSVKNPAILVELLEKGDDLRKLLIGVDDKKRTFLHYLADAPLTQEEIPKLRIIIKTLLENQTLDINAVAEDGNTALHKSIQAKNLYLTELLLDLRGLDIEKTNKDGHKAIDLCENKPELYRIFIRYMNKLERDDNITYVRNTPILQAFDSDYKYPSLLVTPRTNLSNDREYKKLSKHNKQKSTTALPRSHNSSGSKRNRSQSGITSDDTVQTSSTSGSSELSSNSNQFSEELSERDSKFQPLSPISFSFKYKEWGEAFKQSTSSVTNEILQDFSKLSKEYILPDPSQLISKLNTPTSEHLTYLFITNYLNSVIQGKKADVFRKLDRIPNYFIYATLNQPDDVILGNSNPIIATPNFDAIDLSHLNPEDYEKRKNLINYLWTLTSCHYKENGKNQRRFNKKKIADTTLGLLTEFSILDICRATRNIYKQLDNDQKICANLIIMFSIIFSYREVNELSAEIQAQIDIIIGLNNKSDSLESPRKSTETISIKYQIKEIMENIISKCLMIDQDVADVGNSEKKFTRDSLPVDHEIQNFKNMCALYDQLSSPETLVDFNQLVTKAMTTEDTHAQFELTGLVAREIKKLTITMFQELRFIDLTEENSVVLTNYTNTTEKIGNYLKNKILSDQNPYKGLNFLLELSKHILSSDSKEFSDLNFLYEINAILISPEIYNLPEFDKLDKQTLKEIEEITSPLRNNINHNQFYKKHERTLPQISFTKRAIIAAIEGNSDRMERYEAIGKSVVQFMETKCITQGKFIHQTNIISSLESYQILSNEQLREKMLEHCAASSIALTEELKFDVLLELIDKNYLSQGIVPGAIKNSEYTSPKKLAHKLVEILSERVDKFSIDEKELYYKQLEKIIDKIFTTKLSNLTKNEMTDVRNKMKQLKNKIKGTKEPGFQKLSTHQSRHTLASPLMFTRDKENKDESRTIVINLNSYSENILGLLEQIHTLCQQKESNTEFFYKNEKLESISKLPSCLIAMIQENLRQKPLTEENRKILLSQVEKLQEIIPGVLGLCQKQHAYSNEENEQIIKDIIQLKDEISKSNETVQGTPNLGLSIAGARAMLFQHNRHLSEPTATTASNTNQSPSHSND